MSSLPDGGECTQGGYKVGVAQKGAFWRGQPSLKSCISLSTHDWLREQGASFVTNQVEPEPTTLASISKVVSNNTEPSRTSHGSSSASDACAFNVSSEGSLIDQHGGHVNIYACPGGKAACPGGPVCADDHKGPACALCWNCADECRERGADACAACKGPWAQDASRRCIRCEINADHFRVLFAAVIAAALMILLYVFSIRPIRNASTDGAISHRSCWIYNIACVQKMVGAINCMLSSAATKYLAWTVNNDPYAAKAFAKPQRVLDSIDQGSDQLSSGSRPQALHVPHGISIGRQFALI